MQHFPNYYHYFSVTEFRFNGKTYKNHNKLLADYPGTDGLKTGYIAASGFNVAVSVSRDGHRLIGVVFGGKTAKSRDAHMAELLDKSFARLDDRRFYAEGDDVEVQLVAAGMPTGDPWGIQIGAYSTVTAATRALDLAERHLNASLAGAAAALMPIEANGKTLIRARYLGAGRTDGRSGVRAFVGQRFALRGNSCAGRRARRNDPLLTAAVSLAPA